MKLVRKIKSATFPSSGHLSNDERDESGKIIKENEVRFLPFFEFEKYKELGKEYFPNADWQNSEEKFGKMYGKWDKGIIVFEKVGQIVGYITLWPITECSARKFENGNLGAYDISHLLIPEIDSGKHLCWIMTAIAVKEKSHDTRKAVILGLLNKFFSVLREHLPCIIYAHAVTYQGEKFLVRTGFSRVPDNPFNLFKLILNHERNYVG